MPISDIINVQISIASAGFPRTGYGTPLILSPHQLFNDRVRTYSDLDGMVADGFTSASPEYKAAAAAWAQTPKPVSIKIGKLLNRPVPAYDLTPIAANTTAYGLEIEGNAVSFTSDSSGTVAEIVTGLDGLVDALSLSGLTSTDGTTKLTLSKAAGGFIDLFVAPEMTTRLTVLCQTPDPGVATDLDAIKLYDPDWYWIINLHNSKAIVAAIAAWTESNTRFFEARTQDSVVINTILSGNDDVAEAVKVATDTRTRLVYHPDAFGFLDAAEMGRIAPTDPGTATFSDKTLAGVDYYTLTATQRANALAKNVGVYERLGDVGRTRNGKTSGGEWADVVIARDALVSNIQAAVYDVISAGDKLAYTDDGIAAVQGAILGELNDAVRTGVLAASPAPACTVPRASAVSGADKAARTLTGVKFDGVLAGAIVAVTPIRGTLTT